MSNTQPTEPATKVVSVLHRSSSRVSNYNRDGFDQGSSKDLAFSAPPSTLPPSVHVATVKEGDSLSP